MGHVHSNSYTSTAVHAVSQPAPGRGIPGQGLDLQEGPGSAAWIGAVLRAFAISASEFDAYVSMARPVNVLPSLLLVVVGALSAAKHWSVLLNPTVWAMAFASCGIAVSSVVVNDYFDFRLGVDTVNAPEKPLPSGKVTPDGALLFSSFIYIAVLMVACTLPDSMLRLIIALSAAATLAYTPVLKRMTAMKNLTVAFIIAGSPLAGAFATGLGSAAWSRVLPIAAFLFSGVCYREILMDINDRTGDGAAGLKTIPVVLGLNVALAIAVSCMLCGLVVGTSALAAACASSALGIASSACIGATALFVLNPIVHVAGDVRNIVKSKYEHDAVSDAIGRSFGTIGRGMILLAICL